jgi:hypothetical protein
MRGIPWFGYRDNVRRAYRTLILVLDTLVAPLREVQKLFRRFCRYHRI